MKQINALITAAQNDSRIHGQHPESAAYIGETITGRQAIIRQQKGTPR
jgi:hypothetical protein